MKASQKSIVDERNIRKDYMVKMSHIHKAIAREELFPCGNVICSLIWNVDFMLHALKSQAGDVIGRFNARNNNKIYKFQWCAQDCQLVVVSIQAFQKNHW